MKKNKDWSEPVEVSDLDLCFPGEVSHLLPDWNSLPEDFRREKNKFCDVAQNLFFSGGQFPKCKPGVDTKKAIRHFRTVISSFEPKHEHKIAGAGYLLSLWCEPLEAK